MSNNIYEKVSSIVLEYFEAIGTKPTIIFIGVDPYIKLLKNHHSVLCCQRGNQRDARKTIYDAVLYQVLADDFNEIVPTTKDEISRFLPYLDEARRTKKEYIVLKDHAYLINKMPTVVVDSYDYYLRRESGQIRRSPCELLLENKFK